MYKLLMLCFVIGAARCGLQPLTRCKPEDSACFAKNSKIVYPQVIAGDSALSIESMDPLHINEIEGKLATVYYKFTDVTLTGLKDCNLENIKLNPNIPNLYFDIICPQFSLSGKYEVQGRLFLLPVEGKGTFTIDSKEYRFGIDSELKKAKGSDGKDYYSIKNFKLEMDPRGGVSYDFKNLFNGNKQLSDGIHKFAKDNWREVTLETQGPVMNAVMKSIIKNINKFMKLIPIEGYLILN